MLRKITVIAASLGLLLMGGCVAMDADLANLLSAGAKLASNPSDPPIGDLTDGELIAISANLPELAAQFPQLGIPAADVAGLPTLTLQQARDAVAFLDTHNIQTVSEFQNFLVQVSRGEVDVEIPASLIEFAASLGFETDSAKLIAAI